MENILPTNFTNLILALQYRKTYQRALLMTKQKFNLKQSNIQDLTPFKTLQLYRTVVKKFYMNRTKIIEGSWFQNELRVFLWLLVGYLFIHKKQISEMDKEDWSYFTPIFHQRPAISFQFQALSLLPNSRSAKWSSGEMDLLQSIIKEKKFKNKWNSIARELFIRSEKQFYRTPKQCRQRWLNYLDPNKKKTGWEHAEDLILLKTISNYGKKWSAAVRMLKNTRTEHMVKNRYKSMIATEQKKHPKQSENEILLRLIKQIEAIVYRIKIQETQKPVFSTTHIKTQYQDSSTENHNLVKQEPLLPQTSSEYTQQAVPYISMIRPSFFAQNSLYPLMSFNSPSHHPNHESFLQNSSKLCSNEINFCAQQNEFLMSQQELSNYMLFQGKEKESLMKDEELEEKMGDDGYMCVDKHEKINYFSQEFHDCFH